MTIRPSYIKMVPDNTAIVTTPVMNSDGQLTGYKIACSANFESTIDIASPPHFKNGTMTVEIVYKTASGTLKLQDSVNGLNFRDIPLATVTLASSGTEQSEAIKLTLGIYANNFLKCVWTGSGAGYVIINIA